MTEFTFTSKDPKGLLCVLGEASIEFANENAPQSMALIDELRDQLRAQVKPAIEEPTGDVIVFVGGEYWQREADTEDSWVGSYDRAHATWRELTATRHEVEIYRREQMPLTAAALSASSVRAHQEKRGARFCTLTQNCRMADGHADGCKP